MTSVSAPVLQKQNRNKHSSMPHLLQMAAAWLSSATPALVSIHRQPSASPPAGASESTEPTPFDGGALGPGCLAGFHPPQSSRAGCLEQSAPLQVHGESGESSISCDTWKGGRGNTTRKSSGAASSSTLPGHSY